MKYILNKKIITLSLIIYSITGLVLCVLCNVVNSNSVFNFNIQIWQTSCQYIDFFLPLFAPVIFVVGLFYRKKNRFLDYVSVRMKKRKYIIRYITSSMFLTLVFATAMYYMALLYSVFVLKINPAPGENYFYNNVFGKIQAENPALFGLAWCAWKGFIASLFVGVGCSFALYIDNIFVVIILPFIYVMAENLITGLLQVPQHSIFTSLDINRLDPEGMHVYNFVTGVVLFVIISSLIILIVGRRAKRIYAVV